MTSTQWAARGALGGAVTAAVLLAIAPAAVAATVLVQAETDCSGSGTFAPDHPVASGGAYRLVSAGATVSCTVPHAAGSRIRVYAYAGGEVFSGQWRVAGARSWNTYSAPADSPDAWKHRYFDLQVSQYGSTTLEIRPDDAGNGLYLDVITVVPEGEEPTYPPAPPPPPPTEEPTDPPTTEPTEEPTDPPTTEPTEEPTDPPTTEPTEEPTEPPPTEPTDPPTEPPPPPPDEPDGPAISADDRKWIAGCMAGGALVGVLARFCGVLLDQMGRA